MSSTKGMFIGLRRDRMGARLLMMLTCIRLAEDFNTSYKVNWFPQGADAPELNTPEEIFSKEWMKKFFVSSREFDQLTNSAKPIWTFQNDPSPDRMLAHLNSGNSIIVEEGFEVLAFPWEDIEKIRPRYRDFINQIGFNPMIRAIMDKADNTLSGEGVSAYHIRRGDILNGLPWKHSTWPSKIEPEEYYDRHLEKKDGSRAIMFSDQPELVQQFQARHPKLMQMKDIEDLSKLTRAQRDFLELYTMSRADQIIAPSISAFSMAAARISGRQRLVFKDVLNTHELDEARDRVIERVKKGPNAFLNPSETAHIYSKAFQYLSAQDRSQEAYDLAKPILEAGADNAFLYLLQALNCFYLKKWSEAEEIAQAGLSDPQLWPEDYAVMRALLGAILGARKKRWGAGLNFLRGFWSKPLRPDVVILGSRIVYRNQLPPRLCPPVDWKLQRFIRQNRLPPFNNMHLVQWQIIARRPCNFDMILLDWHELALDQKARRLLENPNRLRTLQIGLENVKDVEPDDPSYRSLQIMLKFYLKEMSVEASIGQMRDVIKADPDNSLYYKRLADLLEASEEYSDARIAYGDALARAPENPFVMYTSGTFLQRIGAKKQGQKQILLAAELDKNTAAIQGEAGRILMQSNDYTAAKSHLQLARNLCPTFQRYSNQLERIS